MTFAEKVRRRREQRGLSRRKLADAIGVSETCVRYWETGQRGTGQLRAWTAYGLARELGMRVEDVIAQPRLEEE